MNTRRLTIEFDVDMDELPTNEMLHLNGYIKFLPNGKAELYGVQLEWNPTKKVFRLFDLPQAESKE